MKIAAEAELLQLDFVRTKYFARSADRVVYRSVEVVRIGNIGADLRREELGIECGFFSARVAVQPGPVPVGKRIDLFFFRGRGFGSLTRRRWTWGRRTRGRCQPPRHACRYRGWLVAAGGLPKFAAVTAGTFGPGPVLAGAGDASLRSFEAAPAEGVLVFCCSTFCCSTSARKRSTSARNALNSSRISCCSDCAATLEPGFAEDVASFAVIERLPQPTEKGRTPKAIRPEVRFSLA